MYEIYPFSVEPLPYDYHQLEPVLDAKTLHHHHDELYAKYVEQLNAILHAYPSLQRKTLEELLISKTLPLAAEKQILRNAGGVYNHQLYFASMTPYTTAPSFAMKKLIEDSFDTMDCFFKKMYQWASTSFGSGYTWILKRNETLEILNLPNQKTPLTDSIKPILCLDFWEHAYYLQYQHRKSDYANNWFSLINWNHIETLC